MKQRISIDDLKSLSPEQQEKLREWWQKHVQEGDKFYGEIAWDIGVGEGYYFSYKWDKPHKDWMPLLSIGQLIQLLIQLQPYKDWECQFMLSENLCDDLWDLVKRVL